MNSSFQLLLYIMKVKSQKEQQFCSLNFSGVMWKPPIRDKVGLYLQTVLKKIIIN